jgi:CRISPR system Cascade subunit CasE
MKPLFMIEIEFDLVALYHFLHRQGISRWKDDTGLGYGIHAWLGAAFGDLAPKPWRLLMDKHRPPRILGYAAHNADDLKERMMEFALPSVLQVCPEPHFMIASRSMPIWSQGRRLGFQTLVCPTGRKARSGTEKDLFLIHADTSKSKLCREEVYCKWAERRLERYSTIVDSIQMAGFRLVKQIRPTQPLNGKRNFKRIIRPWVLLEGKLTIQDPRQFTFLLSHGVGRHRAFGYGMILLRPLS